MRCDSTGQSANHSCVLRSVGYTLIWLLCLASSGCDSQEEQIASLLEKLSHPHPAVCTPAEQKLISIGDPAIPALIGALHNERWVGRGTPAYVLGRIGVPAIPALLEVADQASPKVQAKAIVALWYMGNAAVPALRSALEHPDVSVRRASAYTLGALGRSTQVPAAVLIRILMDQGEWVGDTYAEIKPWGARDATSTNVISLLTKSLQHPDQDVSAGARNLLQHIGVQEAQEAPEADR